LKGSGYLVGLKENAIMEELIPAGTGMKRYQHVDIEVNTEGKTWKNRKKNLLLRRMLMLLLISWCGWSTKVRKKSKRRVGAMPSKKRSLRSRLHHNPKKPNFPL
jgi:hypothetical protein